MWDMYINVLDTNNRGIVNAPKIKLYSIHYKLQFEMYSNKEKRIHYPAEVIQMFDNKSPQLYKHLLTRENNPET